VRSSREPLFLARQSYRRRRLTDAIRLVPVLGALLFLIPVLNMSGGNGTTLVGGIYLFVSWLALIALSGLLARVTSRPDETPEETPRGSEDG